MKKRTKTVALAATLAGALTVGGIISYFTDADTATNTFTIGKVSLDLQEPSWDPDQANNLTPNQVVAKDPLVKNDGRNSEYVFMEVSVPYKNVITVNEAGGKQAAADTELISYTINNGWTEIGEASKDLSTETVLHRYVYGTNQKCTELAAGAMTPSLFQTFTVVNFIEDQALEESVQNIKVNAYGIQSNDIGTDDQTAPDDVWKVIEKQAPSKDKAAEHVKTDSIIS